MSFPIGKLVVISGFLVLAGYFTNEALESWSQSPASTSIYSAPLREFEFPAITVCSEYKLKWIGILNILTDQDKDGKIVSLFKVMPFRVKEMFLDQIKTLARLELEERQEEGDTSAMNETIDIAITDIDGVQAYRTKFVNAGWTGILTYLEKYLVILGVDRVPTLMSRWRRELFDFWFESRKPEVSVQSLADAWNDVDGLRDIDVLLNETSISNLSFAYNEFHFLMTKQAQMVQEVPYRQFIAFLLDFFTNYPRKYYEEGAFIHQHWPYFWGQFFRYLRDVAFDSGFPLPANLFEDMFNSPGPNFYSNYNWHPDVWNLYQYIEPESYEESFILKAMGCMYPKNHFGGLPDFCNDVIKTLLAANHTHYLDMMLQPVHFIENSTYFNYPMIPFCWFGYLHQWLGDVPVYYYSREFSNGNPIHEYITWCNVFVPAVPVRENCYSVNTKLASKDAYEFGDIYMIGPDYGFLFVLDFGFGPNSHTIISGVSHKLYIHERDSAADLLKITDQGIDITAGFKHDISFRAEDHTVTEAFSKLPLEQRSCVMDHENPLYGVATGKFHFYDFYTQTNCILEAILDLSWLECNCTTWDMYEYLGLGPDDTRICVTHERNCFERYLHNYTIYGMILHHCPIACSKKSYFVDTVYYQNLTQVPLLNYKSDLVKPFIDEYLSSDLKSFNGSELDYFVRYFPYQRSKEATKAKRLETMTVVSINFAPGDGLIFVKDVKASFSDKLGVIGGTFGIFVGASFLGLYEWLSGILTRFQKKIQWTLKKPFKPRQDDIPLF